MKQNDSKFDITIIGAGPTGLAFACGLGGLKVKVAIIDKFSKKIIAKPKKDGREIALTHNSIKVLKRLNVWNSIPKQSKSVIKEARVLDGESKYFLNFNHEEIQKENLGYLVPNYLIRKNLFLKLKKFSNITLIDNSKCESININKDDALVLLSNGKKIKSSLIVAADSRFSKMRSKMGISAFIKDFDKNMIVCRMKHEKPHKNIAYEFFRYNQTQASLPCFKNESSIVTTASKSSSENLMKMNDRKFNSEMESNFNNFLGKMKVVGKRYSYPMVTTYAKKFVSHRFALIGDAAVGMHPVTANGFNLNLKGIEILINEIVSSIKNKADIGSAKILESYQFKLHRSAIPLYLTTNSIVNLYTSNILPAKITRQFMLRLANTVKPIKQTFLNILR